MATGSGSDVDFGCDLDGARGRGGGRENEGSLGPTVPGVTGPAGLESDLDLAKTLLLLLLTGDGSEPSQGLAEEVSSGPRRRSGCWSANSPWGSYMLARSRRGPRVDASHDTNDPWGSMADGLVEGPVDGPTKRE